MTPATRLAVVVGGALGTLARWALAGLPTAAGLPVGTLTANLVGALALGWLLTTLGPGDTDPRWTPVTAGVLGALTTFSTLVLEVIDLWAAAPARAGLYLSITILGGLAGAAVGRRLATGART